MKNSKLPLPEENPTGLHQKYVIRKVIGIEQDFFHQTQLATVPVDPEAEYFVMRLDMAGKDINHIRACRIGIHAYADAIEASIPGLAKDLRERYPLIQLSK